MANFRVGVDSYSLSPLRLAPLDVLEWAAAHGAEGVQFSEVNLPAGQSVDRALLAELKKAAQRRGLYLEWAGGQHIPYDTNNWQHRDIVAHNKAAAEQAHALGATVLRSCSGGLMRWGDQAPPTEVLLREMVPVLRVLQPVFTDLNVVLALELHFEFTTFELLRLFELCAAEPGGYLGICLDTMNLVTMLEDPVWAVERILPWIVAVHVKDGGLLLDEQGLVSFTAEIGSGVVDFTRILARLARLARPVHLSVEDHGGSFALPIFDATFLSRFPDLTAAELARLLRLAQQTRAGVEAGRLRPLERAAWPTCCAARVGRGIESMKRIVTELGNASPAV